MPEPVIIDRSNFQELGVHRGDVVLDAEGKAVGTVERVWGSPEFPGRITVTWDRGGEETPSRTCDSLVQYGWRFCRIEPKPTPPGWGRFKMKGD